MASIDDLSLNALAAAAFAPSGVDSAEPALSMGTNLKQPTTSREFEVHRPGSYTREPTGCGVASLQRCIALLDLDCFYAQVEHKRLNIPRDQPLAVQQWEGLIAVNYAARAAGVKRLTRAADAVRICPGLRLVHVATIGAEPKDDADEGVDSEEEIPTTDINTQKASLKRYRDASVEVLAVFSRFVPVERASIDEAYLDLSAAVDAMLLAPDCEAQVQQVRDCTLIWTGADGGIPFDESNSSNRRLLVGAAVVRKIRAAVFDELGFTVSAGIAVNKQLAKTAAALHKPDKQTLVPAENMDRLMHSVSLTDVRGLGGKLGALVQAMPGMAPNASAGSLQRFTLAELTKHIGEKYAPWLFSACRGIDTDPICVNDKVKSILAAKSFKPVSTQAEAVIWLRVLATELRDRLETGAHPTGSARLTFAIVGADRARFQRQPQSMIVQYSQSCVNAMRSRTCHMPSFGAGVPALDALVKSAADALRGAPSGGLPVHRLALGCSDFVDLPRGMASIAAMFASHAASATLQTTLASAVASPAPIAPPHSPPKLMGIRRFFTPREPALSVNPVDEASLWRCPLCGSAMLPDQQQVHGDWHMARNLQNQEVSALDAAGGPKKGDPKSKKRDFEGDLRRLFARHIKKDG